MIFEGSLFEKIFFISGKLFFIVINHFGGRLLSLPGIVTHIYGIGFYHSSVKAV